MGRNILKPRPRTRKQNMQIIQRISAKEGLKNRWRFEAVHGNFYLTGRLRRVRSARTFRGFFSPGEIVLELHFRRPSQNAGVESAIVFWKKLKNQFRTFKEDGIAGFYGDTPNAFLQKALQLDGANSNSAWMAKGYARKHQISRSSQKGACSKTVCFAQAQKNPV